MALGHVTKILESENRENGQNSAENLLICSQLGNDD